MALVLALGGSYGVTSYLVSQRTREIGIRVALGARSADIVQAVLRRSLITVTAGVAVGVAASLGSSRLLADLLFGVPPHDLGHPCRRDRAALRARRRRQLAPRAPRRARGSDAVVADKLVLSEEL